MRHSMVNEIAGRYVHFDRSGLVSALAESDGSVVRLSVPVESAGVFRSLTAAASAAAGHPTRGAAYWILAEAGPYKPLGDRVWRSYWREGWRRSVGERLAALASDRRLVILAADGHGARVHRRADRRLALAFSRSLSDRSLADLLRGRPAAVGSRWLAMVV